MTLNEKLVYLRSDNRMSQMKVAEELGVSRQAISRWEVGAALPSTENLKALAVLYGVSVDALVNETVEFPLNQSSVSVLSDSEPAVSEMQPKRNAGRRLVWIAVGAVMMLLTIFAAGYALGSMRAAEKMNNDEPIPLSDMNKMEWDFSDAEEFTYGWPDWMEGGE